MARFLLDSEYEDKLYLNLLVCLNKRKSIPHKLNIIFFQKKLC
jgi:hypothetical protein